MHLKYSSFFYEGTETSEPLLLTYV